MAGTDVSTELAPGTQCLITVLDRHFMVDVLEVGAGSVHLSFPGADYPADGMFVELEVHDEKGFAYYRAEVLRGPRNDGDGVIVKTPEGPSRHMHRACCRVRTDIAAVVRDPANVKKYKSRIENMSSGGILLAAPGQFKMHDAVEVDFELGDLGELHVLGEVVHLTQATSDRDRNLHLYGLRFVGLDPQAKGRITEYIWERMRENPPL